MVGWLNRQLFRPLPLFLLARFCKVSNRHILADETRRRGDVSRPSMSQDGVEFEELFPGVMSRPAAVSVTHQPQVGAAD